MDDKVTFVFMFFFAFIGGLFGYQFGQIEAKQAIEECQKELPRNINCKVIAVPVDKK
jgi:hypothetical protein